MEPRVLEHGQALARIPMSCLAALRACPDLQTTVIRRRRSYLRVTFEDLVQFSLKSTSSEPISAEFQKR